MIEKATGRKHLLLEASPGGEIIKGEDDFYGEDGGDYGWSFGTSRKKIE